MRILVATLRYPPYVAGGYEQLTYDAAQALRERGHQVSVICGKGQRFQTDAGILPRFEPSLPEEGEEQNLFARSHAAGNLERARLHFLRRANERATRDALRETESELLLFFNLGLVSLAPIRAARRAGIPTMGFVSDPWPLNHWVEDWGANPTSAKKKWRMTLLGSAWRTFRNAINLGPFCVSSDFLRQRFVADGVPPESMQLLRVPLPPEMEPDPPITAPPTRAPSDPLRIASLSMLWEGKGVHILLAAAAKARKSGIDLRLEIAGAGEGEYRQRLNSLARDPKLKGRVTFHGLLDRAASAALLSTCHGLAFPSIWGEPFPTATIEAMARGLAVIATDAGGTPEQFTNNVEGLIVPAGDAAAMSKAIVRLHDDDAQRQAFGRAGLARVAADYTMSTFTDGLERACQGVLTSSER